MREFIFVAIGFLVALAFSSRTIPVIIRVSRKLKLFAEPNDRSATFTLIPTFGGISIFLGFIMGMTLTSKGFFVHESIYIFASGLIMFLVGMNDDVVAMTARKKLIAEVIIAAILIFWGDYRITNLHGFLGIDTIPFVVSVLLTGFIYVVIINAFNLVDGIDGLASGLSIFSCSVLGVWFFLSGHFEYSVIAFSLVGGLCGFFFFNVYGVENKIFMGDTGSLVVGTIMSILVIQFNEFNIDQSAPFAIASSPAVSFGIFIYPMLDTLRVFSIRILQKKSPFIADKNHTHHRLLALGYNHRQATYTILFFNALFTLAVLYFQWLGIFELMVFNFLVGGFYLLLPSYILSTRNSIAANDPHQQIILFHNSVKVPRLKKEMEIDRSKIQLIRNITEQLKRISVW